MKQEFNPLAPWQWFNGDSRQVMKSWPADFFHCAVTSPPYFGLRDYKVSGQIGLEETPELFLENLLAVFSEVKRVLRPDGVLFVNMGDSYYGSWGNYGGQNRNQGTQREIPKGSKIKNPAYDGTEKFRPPTSFKHPFF